MITSSVLAFNALGDSLRDSLDPIASGQRRLRRRLKREGSLAGSDLPDEIDPLQVAPDSTFPDGPTALG